MADRDLFERRLELGVGLDATELVCLAQRRDPALADAATSWPANQHIPSDVQRSP